MAFATENVNLRGMINFYNSQRGAGKLLFRNALRDYVDKLPYEEAVKEIQELTDARDIDALISVGIKGGLWYIVVGQRARIDGQL